MGRPSNTHSSCTRGLKDECVWGARHLEYLGHVVGDGNIAVPEARVTAIRNFERPVTTTKKKEVTPGNDIILPKIYPLLC